jgi:four helix bundle protein
MYEFTALDPFRRHPGLRDQLERAALSISNNIAEGFERGTTNELLAFLYVARGSAGEVRSMMRVLERWDAFGDYKSQISNFIVQSEKISKQFYGWIESFEKFGNTWPAPARREGKESVHGQEGARPVPRRVKPPHCQAAREIIIASALSLRFEIRY